MFLNLAKAIEVHFRHRTMIDVRMHRASEVEKVGIAFPSQMNSGKGVFGLGSRN